MNIFTATMKAKKTNGYITRQSVNFKDIVIKPTNTGECCVVISKNKSCPRWQPTEEDIIANDWTVVYET